MEGQEKAKELAENLKSNIKIFAKETVYHAGNIRYLLENILHVLIRFKLKLLGLAMLGVPALYFDEGRDLVLNIVHSIADQGLIDIFVLFAAGSIIITWCTFAIYLIFFK